MCNENPGSTSAPSDVSAQSDHRRIAATFIHDGPGGADPNLPHLTRQHRASCRALHPVRSRLPDGPANNPHGISSTRGGKVSSIGGEQAGICRRLRARAHACGIGGKTLHHAEGMPRSTQASQLAHELAGLLVGSVDSPSVARQAAEHGRLSLAPCFCLEDRTHVGGAFSPVQGGNRLQPLDRHPCQRSAYTGHARVGVFRPAEAGADGHRSRHMSASSESA